MVFGVLIIIALIFFLFFRSRNAKKPLPDKDVLPSKKINHEYNDKILYKDPEIRTFEMKGISDDTLSSFNSKGSFVGFAVCHMNDQYEVAIMDMNNLNLGYVPKGNRRLHDSILEWHEGKLFFWGSVTNDKQAHEWSAQVMIPLGLDKQKIEEFEIITTLISFQLQTLKKAAVDSNDYFTIFNNQLAVQEWIKSSGNKHLVFPTLPAKLISDFSKQLEKEEDWKGIIELEKYSYFIEKCNASFKEAIKQRIEAAKAKS